MDETNNNIIPSKSNADFIDVEEELERFTLCTGKSENCIIEAEKSEKPCTSRDYKVETDLIPLLINDIHLLTLPDRSFAETITAYGFPFGFALIYGRICSTGAGANGKLRYCLDDGTGIIQVRLVKREDPKELARLDLECYRTFGNNGDLYNSVKSLLKITRSQLLEVGPLPYGTKALLIGRPHRSFEEVVFSVFEMIIDPARNNDMEISVKNFIVDWYTKQYKGHQLKDIPMHPRK